MTILSEQLIGTSSSPFSRDSYKPGQSYEPAGTPGQGLKIGTVPANLGRMVTLHNHKSWNSLVLVLLSFIARCYCYTN